MRSTVSAELGKIAADLGTEILCCLGSGDDGTVHLLDGGRVIKTTNRLEAAICLELARLREMGCPIDGTPEVFHVGTYNWTCWDEQIIGGVAHGKSYFIVRSEVGDLDIPDHPDVPPSRIPLPGYALDVVRMATSELASACIEVYDQFRVSNIGMDDAGSVCIRDFSRGRVDDHLYTRLDAHLELQESSLQETNDCSRHDVSRRFG